MEDLAWLGLSWEAPVRRQSEHLAEYRAALDRLKTMGVLYRCFHTRASLMAEIGRAPHGLSKEDSLGPHSEPEESAFLAEGRPFAWRLSVKAALECVGAVPLNFQEEGAGPAGETGVITARPKLMGDVIVARKDLGVSYHLAVVVDDAAQGVTHVIRGEDLFVSAHVQRLLQALLGLATPIYRHHRLILRPDGKRFAKRDTAETLRDLRGQGVTPQALRAALAV